MLLTNWTIKRDRNRLLCSRYVLVNITDDCKLQNTEQCNSKNVMYYFINSKNRSVDRFVLHLWGKACSDVHFTTCGFHCLFSKKMAGLQFLWEFRFFFFFFKSNQASQLTQAKILSIIRKLLLFNVINTPEVVHCAQVILFSCISNSFDR